MEEQERIVLKKERWEHLAMKVGTGILPKIAYLELYPGCKTAGQSYRRLIRTNPMIAERIEQVRSKVEETAIRRAAMVRGDVQEMLLDNVESAKAKGKYVNMGVDGGEFIPDHAAVNQSIKQLADINGLSTKQMQKQPRGENDEEAMLTPEQLLKNILRKWAATKGRGMDDESRERLERIAAIATSGRGAEQGPEEPIEVLRPLPEAEGLP